MNLSMKKLGVLVLAAAICCGFSGAASAKDGKGDGPGRYMEQLNEAQRDQARAIFEESKSANRELRETIRAKREQLSDLMKSATPDVAAIEALSKEIGQLRGKAMVAKLATGEKLKQAGLPEMKKPDRIEKRPEDRKGDREEFVNRRVAKLPQEKQAEARKLFEESRTATSGIREELQSKRAELEKAMASGDSANVEALSSSIGELKGKLLAGKIELRQNLEKAGIPANTFDRGDKKDGKKRGKDGKREGKRDKREKRDKKQD